MFDAEPCRPRQTTTVRRNELVHPVEQPWCAGHLPRPQRHPASHRNGERQGDRTRTAHHASIGTDRPRSTLGLLDRETEPSPHPVLLARSEGDELATIDTSDPPGRLRAEASIPVVDEGGRAGHRPGQLAVVAHVANPRSAGRTRSTADDEAIRPGSPLRRS